MGAPFGPPGVALGALGGFVIWGAGEVIGGLVDRAFGDKERCRNEHGDKEDKLRKSSTMSLLMLRNSSTVHECKEQNTDC